MEKEIEKYLIDPEAYYRDLYVNLGIRSRADQLIQSLGSIAEPIRYTHDLWYSKTKPVLPVIMALEAGVNHEKAAVVGAVIDVLWTLSAVVDDILDKDRTRRSKPAAWRIYGIDNTYRSAQAGLNVTVRYLVKEIGLYAGQACLNSVSLGMASIKRHQAFELSTNPSTLYKNYWERDAFLSSFPIKILIHDPKNPQRIASLACLENYYIGGQLGNDIQDLTRPEPNGLLRLSDIRNGLVTIPIQKLWSNLDETEKQIFGKIFGRNKLNDYEYKAIELMVAKYSLAEQVIMDISEYYDRAINYASVVMNPYDHRVFKSLCESQKAKFLAN